jgi:myosin heavy subunit
LFTGDAARKPFAELQNTSVHLRCGKQLPTPDTAILTKKLQQLKKKHEHVMTENKQLKTLVGVRTRDLFKHMEQEKEATLNATKKEMTKALKVALKTNEKLQKENESVKQLCTDLMDMADEKEEETNKAVKQASRIHQHAKKVAREKHNLQKRIKRKEDKIQKLLERFETDKKMQDRVTLSLMRLMPMCSASCRWNFDGSPRVDSRRDSRKISIARVNMDSRKEIPSINLI